MQYIVDACAALRLPWNLHYFWLTLQSENAAANKFSSSISVRTHARTHTQTPASSREGMPSYVDSQFSTLSQVGRNNFKPPPKVESSVVRITPRGTHEGLNYIEWDGLIRLCFGRKNKTLCAIFRQKEVQAMLLNNYNTHVAMQSRPSLGHAEQGPVAMATDDAKDADKEAVKAKVIKIIEDAGFGTSRAAKLDTDQFLQLLHAFNKEGFHFS